MRGEGGRAESEEEVRGGMESGVYLLMLPSSIQLPLLISLAHAPAAALHIAALLRRARQSAYTSESQRSNK